MPDIVGIDHIYITVRDLAVAEAFYDRVLPMLGFRKSVFAIAGERHLNYYNRHFGYVLRPAHTADNTHNPYSPGLHHLCFRVNDTAEVDEAEKKLRTAGVAVTAAQLYPQYAQDYYAIFFNDPDGIRLEITNFREERRHRHDHWNEQPEKPA